MTTIIEQLNDAPLAGFMLVVTVGYALGKIGWRGITLGPAGGTLAFAILLGALGFDYTAMYGSAAPKLTVGTFGFALFIYSVGFEAGPRFFSSLFGGRAMRFVLVGLVVNVVAFGLGIACGWLFDLGGPITAGVVAGALTSPATYAAALEVVYGEPELAAPLAVSFALVYPLGLVGIVFMLQAVPRLRGRNLAREADAGGAEDEDPEDDAPHEMFRAYRVTEEAVTGRPLSELHLPRRTGCHVTQLQRGPDVLTVGADTVLEPGDHLLVRGRLLELSEFEQLVGPEVDDRDLRNRMPSPRRLVLLDSKVVGKTLTELDLARRFDCLVVGIERGEVHIEPSAGAQVQRGDVLEVVGRRGDLIEAADFLGRLERPSYETDIGVYAGGILLGLILGRLGLDLFGVDLAFGFAGGLLLSGILLGRFRHFGPFSTHVPRAARQLVRDLGILLFVAETGIRAGGSSLAGMEGRLAPMLLTGALVSVVPVVLALWAACRFLKMGSLDAWGSVCGGMTSSSGLTALRRASDTHAASVSYAASYAVASVLVTIAGRVIIVLMG